MRKDLKIFLVADDPFSLAFYQQVFESLGYKKLSLFLNGTVCLNNFDPNTDVVFLDHCTDDLSGFEILKKIKKYNPCIHTIVLSGQKTIKPAIDAFKHGAADYTVKIENDILKIKNALEKIELMKKETIDYKPTLMQKISLYCKLQFQYH